MALIDELTIAARAGRGGDGVVRWLHLKGKEFSGPAGGNGGDGGDVYIRGVRDIGLLARYRGEKRFEAGDGTPGESATMAGARGSDIIIDLPVGSVVTNSSTGERHELTEDGQTLLILKGGRGGAGNAVFKSSVNRRPEQSTPGGPGEEAQLSIELRLIADAGLIGLPNAGKSSLLNALTGTAAKVGAYAFTTLDPNLGALYGHIIADIPGLIEGASAGKGLGFKFLRHVARTRMLVHCVAADTEEPLREYRLVRDEISRFEDGLLAFKPEMVVLTKSDMCAQEHLDALSALFKKELGHAVETVSILDDASVKKLQDTLMRALL